jgi:hypothetical protein
MYDPELAARRKLIRTIILLVALFALVAFVIVGLIQGHRFNDQQACKTSGTHCSP